MSELSTSLLTRMQLAARQTNEEWLDLEQQAAYACQLADSTDSNEDAEERVHRLGLDSSGRTMRSGGWGRQPRNGSQRADATPGEQFRFQSHLSPWWQSLQDQSTLDPNSAAGRKFRGRFRIPRKMFDELIVQAIDSGLFSTKKAGEMQYGPVAHPLELKVLACLRYLASGTDFVMMEELACISATVLEKFFHKWTAWVGNDLFRKWVTIPRTESEVAIVEGIYSRLGFPGTICSIDGVHVPWHCCPATRSNLHVGKEGYPTRAFNVAVGPTRRIFHVGPSHPGARNDKTMSKYDWYMQQLRSGLYSQHAFNCFDKHGHLIEQKGLHAITDAGYCRWFCLMYPLRHPSTLKERRWSKRCESVRKDTERTFGVLKKRFYLLKAGFRFRHEHKIDNTFFACCVLHNMLLHNDQLDTIGQREVDWRAVNFDLDDVRIQRDIDEHRHIDAEASSSTGPAAAAATPQSLRDLRRDLRDAAQADDESGSSSFFTASSMFPSAAEDRAHCLRRELLLDHFHVASRLGGVQWLQAATDCRPTLKALFECEDRTSEVGDDVDLEELEDTWEVDSCASASSNDDSVSLMDHSD